MFELKKIGILKRVSAWLLDTILLAVLATGFMYLISLMCHYQREEDLSKQNFAQWDAFRSGYIPSVAANYGFTYEVDDEGNYSVDKDGQPMEVSDIIAALIEDVSVSHGFTFTRDGDTYTLKKADGTVAAFGDIVATFPQEELSPMEAAFKAYADLPSAEKLNAQYRYVNSMLFMMISVGLALSFLILEFIVPVCLKNGQTIGKKVFSICLVRPPCVKVKMVALFARTVIGKFAIETMFPILLIFMLMFGVLGSLAIILLAALLIFNIILFFATKNHTPIHDILAVTAAADMKEQMIFASEEELNERKAEARREAALLEKENK